MPVDLTVTLGTIIQTAVLTGGGVIALVTVRNTVATLQQQVGSQVEETKAQFAGVHTELKKIGEILISQARFDERLTNLDKRVTSHGRQIDELRHGEGFVRGGPRLSVDGEYNP